MRSVDTIQADAGEPILTDHVLTPPGRRPFSRCGMREIPLTRGKVALVDDEDYESIARHKWYYRIHKGCRIGYACRTDWSAKPRRMLRMHREIVNAPAGSIVDHLNGNGLDNRRCNLRICTNGANIQRGRSRNATGFRGVVRQTGRPGGRYVRYQASIGSIRRINCGSYPTPAQAALAYDEAVLWIYGRNAATNILRPEDYPELVGPASDTEGVQ